MRRRSTAVPAGIFVAVLSAFVVLLSNDAPSMAGKPTPQISQAIQSRIRPNGWVRVLVELKLPNRTVPEASLKNLTAVLAQRQIIGSRREKLLAKLPPGTYRVLRTYLTIPYVAMDVTTSSVAILADSASDVEAVMPDALARPDLADSGPLVQADQAWSVGYDGTGVAVGIVDTGVDATHPFLAGKVAAEACYSSTVAGVSESVCPNHLDEQHGTGAAAPCASDDCFHGTHVAGVAAGDGRAAGQSFSGVARGSTVLAVQAFSRVTDPNVCAGGAPCVAAFSSDILAALEQLYILSWDYRIAAINLSLGSNLPSAACDGEPYKAMVDNLRAVGIATVVASGNAGATSALASPACVSSAVSVGSTTKADRLSSFSNVAPSLSLLAPGESIASALPLGGYGALSGTSMAAAHVSGAFAVMRQALPDADVATLLDAFRRTGLPIADTRPSGGTIVPRLRLFEALASLARVPNPVPRITSLTPNGARAGAPAFSLTIDGSGFDAFSVARWNGSPRPTQVVSARQLNASITAADIASVGSALVSVSTPAPGGGTSSALTFTIDPPATLTPSATRVAPGSDVTVTLANGFGGASDWLALAATSAPDNTYLQQMLVGTGVTSRTWTVTMPTTPGTYEFRLFVSDVRKAKSVAVTVDRALTPAPVASSLSPDSVVAGSSAFTLTVHGNQFVPWSVVRWNGANRMTTFVSSTELQAAIDAADVATGGPAQVSVLTPAPGGGASGNLTFTIANPVPGVVSLSPSSVTAGAAAFNVTVSGSGFASASLVRWNGATRPTTFVSGTQLQASVSASDVATAGTAQVSVVTPAPGGGTSGDLAFTVENPAPSALSLSPSSVTAGAAAFTMTVTGSGFVNASVVRWNGVNRPTSFVSGTQLQASIVASDVAAAGTAQVSVVTPAPGGGTSGDSAFTIANPVPGVLSLSPSSLTAGAPAFTLTVTGSGFVSASLVRWNGAARTTTFVNGTQLQASIPASDVAAAGMAQVSVWTPAPGGGSSGNLPLTIANPAPSLTGNPTMVVGGTTVTVMLNNGLGGAEDWLAFADVSAPNTNFLTWTYVGPGVTSRTWTVTTPTTGGPYEFRLFPNGGYTRAATSSQIIIVPPAPVITSLNPNTARAGTSSLTLDINGSNFTPLSVVQWNGSPRTTTYFSPTLLTARITAADLAVAGTAPVTVVTPAPGGGTSNAVTFTVTAPPTLTVNTTTVARGGSVTVTLTDGFGGGSDWLAFAASSAPNGTYLQWMYVGTGVTTRTWTITVPATAGTYEFRLFLNDGFTRAATSPTVTVQ
jgi:subtilisin family serine protease